MNSVAERPRLDAVVVILVALSTRRASIRETDATGRYQEAMLNSVTSYNLVSISSDRKLYIWVLNYDN
jgi:hypothetical protein